jgi:hypothetical protein
LNKIIWHKLDAGFIPHPVFISQTSRFSPLFCPSQTPPANRHFRPTENQVGDLLFFIGNKLPAQIPSRRQPIVLLTKLSG